MPKQLTSDFDAFDIRQLMRSGRFHDVPGTPWVSASHDLSVAWVSHERPRDGNHFIVEMGEYEVLLETTTTPCHLGGERIWLKCPRCLDRVAVVYWMDYEFSCRKCADLVYPTQRMNKFDRLETAAGKLRRRLEWKGKVGGPLPEKPRWMRWYTYYRLVVSWCNLKRASFDLIVKEMEQLYGPEVRDRICSFNGE